MIVDRSEGGAPRILMGRRRPDQVFLPNKYVFPGGRVERSDHAVSCADALPGSEMTMLRLALPSRRAETFPRALALAAIRETFEETGIVIGRRLEHVGGQQSPLAWRPFLATGFAPSPAALSFFARAITPPGRPRRYDTRFFIVPASEIALKLDVTDGELSSLDWFTLEAMETLDLPNITRLILKDLAAILNAPDGAARAAVPFYFHRDGAYTRELLSNPRCQP